MQASSCYQHRSEPSGTDRQSCGTAVCTAWIRRLESIYSPDHRIYGKRERGIYTDGSSWWKNSITVDFVYAVYCLRISDLYPALYALCGSSSNCTKRNGNRKGGCRHCAAPVRDCVDRCVHRAWDRNVVWIIKNSLHMAFHKLQKTFCGRCGSHIFFMGDSDR